MRIQANTLNKDCYTWWTFKILVDIFDVSNNLNWSFTTVAFENLLEYIVSVWK